MSLLCKYETLFVNDKQCLWQVFSAGKKKSNRMLNSVAKQ